MFSGHLEQTLFLSSLAVRCSHVIKFWQWDGGGSLVYSYLLLPVGWNANMMADPWVAILDHEVEASAEEGGG